MQLRVGLALMVMLAVGHVRAGENEKMRSLVKRPGGLLSSTHAPSSDEYWLPKRRILPSLRPQKLPQREGHNSRKCLLFHTLTV